jgi:mannose/cellobiose epimerase-like protein (N-acyl-D-glucosamine 2-epimerase family)
MTEMDESHLPSREAVISIQKQLVGWLREHALPVWDQHGVDRLSGGYFENIALVGPQQTFVVSGDTRRGRVVARQIYVFDVGRRFGWRPAAASPVDHGCEYLFSRLHRGDGFLHTAVDAATHRPYTSFCLYEQAFYLFALARLNATAADRYPVAATATRCLERLRAGYGKTEGGFEESNPPTLPLKSNPHMHLLEAALEWIAAASGAARQIWVELARELVGLCLTHFRDQSTGAIREYFDYQWCPVSGEDGRIVEPGHQFEWAWLLMRWADSPHSAVAERLTCRLVARRLIEIGEKWGVDASRGVAINEIWDDMTTKDAAAKLWPQTERVKAWCAMLDAAETEVEAEHACHRIVIAAEGLAKYLRSEAPGLWHETCSADGEFPPGPSKASSLYHVVCAIDVLQKTASARLACGVLAGSDRSRSMFFHDGLS